MTPLRSFAAVAMVTAALWSPAPAVAIPLENQRQVEEALTCQCGCGLTVAACNHLECGFAVPVRKAIAESLARGETGQQILDRYKAEYGEKVLSSPVPEGFNLLAWIAPYLAILVAGVVMFSFFRRRAAGPGAGAAAAGRASGETPPVDRSDERLARLQHDVEDLER